MLCGRVALSSDISCTTGSARAVPAGAQKSLYAGLPHVHDRRSPLPEPDKAASREDPRSGQGRGQKNCVQRPPRGDLRSARETEVRGIIHWQKSSTQACRVLLF